MATETRGKEFFQHVASLAGWDVAKLAGCDYSGDHDPIQHGGFFYETENWEKYGYANIVDFCLLDDGYLYVEQGTVNRPNDTAKLLTAIRNFCGEYVDVHNIHVQIDYCKGYNGYDHSEYGPTRKYRLEDWPHEWRIWKSVYHVIESLHFA